MVVTWHVCLALIGCYVTLVASGCPKAAIECGGANPNGNIIELQEPQKPGPFHDLTKAELTEVNLTRCILDLVSLQPYVYSSVNSWRTLSTPQFM